CLTSRYLLIYVFRLHRTLRYLHSFPTRRSSDLRHFPGGPPGYARRRNAVAQPRRFVHGFWTWRRRGFYAPRHEKQSGRKSTDSRDRKSTRLNSSHVAISYAVFCLKKKNNKNKKN